MNNLKKTSTNIYLKLGNFKDMEYPLLNVTNTREPVESVWLIHVQIHTF